MRIFFMASIALLALAACATTPGDATDTTDDIDLTADPRVGEVADVICFGQRISDFRSIGDQALILRRSPREEYLVITSSCPSAKVAQEISSPWRCRLRDLSRRCVEWRRPSNNCFRWGSDLVVLDKPFPTNNDLEAGKPRCRVRALYEWNEDAGRSEDASD